jgi:hypothetical protein
MLITGLYSYIILSSDIIVGIAYTAPFSPWSYGTYLAKVLPLLLITLLFFITYMYSNQEKQVKQLTFATPVDPYRYGIVKCSAMAAGFFIISLFIIITSMVFYVILFRFYDFGSFFTPVVITLLPCLFFILGIGLLMGSIQVNILYILMIAVLLLTFLPLPKFFDLYGGNFFGSYPLALPVGLDGEPAFTLPVSFILGKVFFSAAGILMTALGIKRYAKTRT